MLEHSILIVEDEHTLRRLLEYRLSKQYRVRTAQHGEEALVRIADEAPDLIISDIMMPKMDGFALQTALQDDKKTRAIPFIFLTAKADEQSRLKGLRTGVDDYITKPFDIDQLLVRINRLLERTAIYQKELNAKIGHDFSQRLMPKKMPEVDGYRLQFYYTPREDGGGDLFDWIETKPGSYLFTIGDVMGKGLQAKFYSFSFLSYIRGTVHAVERESGSPSDLLKRVNDMLVRDEVLEETFASLLLIHWHSKEHRVTFANAGHCRPMVIRESESEIIEHGDLVLGLDPETTFSDVDYCLEPGNAIFAYTDGLIEQRTESGELMGEATVMQAAQHCLANEQPVDKLLSSLLSNSDTDHFIDDILVFWLERTSN